MKRDQLKYLIKEMVSEKIRRLNELDQEPPIKDVSNVQDQSNETEMSPADVSAVEGLKKTQEKLTNDIRRIDGAIKKLEEPLLRKKQQMDRYKSSKEKKLGQTTEKLNSIQKKYQ